MRVRTAGSMRQRGLGLANTVGMYSPGKAFVVYEISRHVCEDGDC